MIEVTTKTLDGVSFLTNAKIVEPREKRNGVYVELVSERMYRNTEMGVILKGFGLRKVGHDLACDYDIYTFHPWGYWQYRVVRYLLRAYWWLIRFLYDNARMFKEIPPSNRFSWSYFTPYVWVRNALGKIKSESQ